MISLSLATQVPLIVMMQLCLGISTRLLLKKVRQEIRTPRQGASIWHDCDVALGIASFPGRVGLGTRLHWVVLCQLCISYIRPFSLLTKVRKYRGVPVKQSAKQFAYACKAIQGSTYFFMDQLHKGVANNMIYVAVVMPILYGNFIWATFQYMAT